MFRPATGDRLPTPSEERIRAPHRLLVELFGDPEAREHAFSWALARDGERDAVVLLVDPRREADLLPGVTLAGYRDAVRAAPEHVWAVRATDDRVARRFCGWGARRVAELAAAEGGRTLGADERRILNERLAAGAPLDQALAGLAWSAAADGERFRWPLTDDARPGEPQGQRLARIVSGLAIPSAQRLAESAARAGLLPAAQDVVALLFEDPDTGVTIAADRSGDAVNGVVALVARAEARGAALDRAFDAVCSDVAAVLGPAASARPPKGRAQGWAAWRVPDGLLIVAQQGDWERQFGEAVALTALTWPADGPVPDLAGRAEDWLVQQVRARRG